MDNNGDSFRDRISTITWTEEDKQTAKAEYIKRQSQNYIDLYNNEFVSEYFHYLAAAFSLGLGNNNLQVHFRTKSNKSIVKKTEECIINMPFNPQKNSFTVNRKTMSDGFAMKIIIDDEYTNPLQHSPNQEIQNLIEKRASYYSFIKEMQKFRSRLVDDEFPVDNQSDDIEKFDVSKGEYIKSCLQVLENLQRETNPKATLVKDKYNEQISLLENTLSFLESTNSNNESINPEFIKENEPNFLSLFDTFCRTINNEIGQKVVTKRVKKMFEKSELLKQFKIEILGVDTRQKENGFDAVFIIIKTPFGPIELQVQTRLQYEISKYGSAAHAAYKKVSPVNLADEDCVEKIKYVSPSKGSATFYSDYDELRGFPNESIKPTPVVGITDYSLYYNYTSILNELSAVSESRRKYIGDLKELNILPNQNTVRYYTIDNIHEYLSGERFKCALEISNTWKESKPEQGKMFSTLLKNKNIDTIHSLI